MAFVPVLVWFFFLGGGWLGAAVIVFSLAALTDYGDGFMARRRGQVSGLGILLDPVADKVLVTAVFFCFCCKGMLPWWFLGVILGRDILVTSVRGMWRAQPVAMAPSYLGKCKTVAQILFIYVLFAHVMMQDWLMQRGWYDTMIIVVKVIMYLVAAVTAYTGVDYLRRYWKLRRSGPSSPGGGQVVPEQLTPAQRTATDDQVTKVPPLARKGQVKPARRAKMAPR
jgi:CDP-diacylglycerol--glycerol-3-phosphate 3-phosphatidyltransferase